MFPGARPSGAAALNVPPQHGHVPPCRTTRVTSGTIGGISTWSDVSIAACAAADTSAAQCGHIRTHTVSTRVGVSHGGRCAPFRRRSFDRAGVPSPSAFWLRDGGTLAFRGVFFGSPSLMRSDLVP
jgi:hypothetical protein